MKSNKAIKIIGIIVGVFLLLWVGAALAVRMIFPPEKVKAMVLPKIEQQVGRAVSVEKVGLSVFPYLGAGIKGLSIAETDREGFDIDPLMTIGEFQVRIAVMPLLRGKAEIAEIIIAEPHIKVETDSSGSFNFDDLAFMVKDTAAKSEVPEEPKSSGGLPVPLALHRFEIRDGSIEYVNRKSGESLRCGAINQKTSFSIDKKLTDVSTRGQLTVDDISVETKDLSSPLKNVRITLDHDIGANLSAGTATIHTVRASAQDVYVNLSGTIENFLETPRVDLVLTTDTLALAHVLDVIPKELVPDLAGARGSGNLLLKVDASGELDSTGMPDINGLFALDQGQISYPDLPQSIDDIDVAIGFTADSINISRCNVRLGQNPIRISGWLREFNRPEIAMKMKASVKLDDLAEIMPMPEGNAVGGTVDADIGARGTVDPSNPSTLELSGKVNLKNVTAVTPAVTKPVVTNGTIMLSSAEIVPDIGVTIGASSMNLKGSLRNWLSLVLAGSTAPRPLLQFTMDSPLLNTDEFLPAGENEEQAGTEGSSGAAGVLVAGSMSPVDLKGTITNNQLVYKGIELRNVRSKVSLVNNVLDMSVDAGILGGTMSNSTHLDASGAPHLKVHTEMDADRVHVGRMVSTMGSLLPSESPLLGHLKNLGAVLDGTGSMKGAFDTKGETADDLTNELTGTMHARLSKGTIQGGAITQTVTGVLGKFIAIDNIEYEQIDGTVRVADGRVMIESMDINSSRTGDWDVGGNVGFDASLDVDIANRLPKGPSNTLAKAQSSGRQAGKSLIASVLGESAANLADQATKEMGIPVDRDGRVTVVVGLGGTVSKPQASGVSFRKGVGTAPATSPEKKPQETVKEQVTERVQNAKQEAQRRLEEEKRRLEEQARQEAEAKRKAAEEELKKKANDAAKKLKRFF